MPSAIAHIWEHIIEASATFYDFILWLNEFSVRFFESEFSKGLFGEGAGFNTVVETYSALPYFLALFGLLEAFFGRKFLSLQKFIFGFVVGFACGTVYIAPVVSNIVALDHFVVGLAIGLVLAVFHTPFYLLSLASVMMYLFYYQCVNTLNFAKFFAFSVSAIIVIIIFLFLLKWVELVGTSMLGALIFTASLGLIIAYPEKHEALIFRILFIFVSLLGLWIQAKYRRRKKSKKYKKS